MARRRVLLADDHAPTMQRWRDLLEPEFEIVGTVTDGQALIDAAVQLIRKRVPTDDRSAARTPISRSRVMAVEMRTVATFAQARQQHESDDGEHEDRDRDRVCRGRAPQPRVGIQSHPER